MFTASLFVISPNLETTPESTNWSTDNKLWNLQTVEHYSVMKNTQQQQNRQQKSRIIPVEYLS